MKITEDPQCCLATAEELLRDAKILCCNEGSKSSVLFLVDFAIEMALKAALVAHGVWDGKSKSDYKNHDIAALAQGVARRVAVPDDLMQELVACSDLPRLEEPSCKSSQQVRFDADLDWDAISIDDHLGVAERTVRFVRNEYFQ